MMKALLTKLSLFSLLVTATSALAAQTTVSQILSDPAAFDGQHVTVSGTAQFVRPKTSRKGNDYETFSICE
jgi:opacity protein-like surface antigen